MTSADDARRAREQSEIFLADVESRWPLVRSLVAPLRRAREENHFADRLRILMEGNR